MAFRVADFQNTGVREIFRWPRITKLQGELAALNHRCDLIIPGCDCARGKQQNNGGDGK